MNPQLHDLPKPIGPIDHLKITEELRGIHDSLAGLSREPSEELRAVMGKIAAISSQAMPQDDSERIIGSISDILPSLRMMQSEAESLLELAWARRAIAAADARETIGLFPYYRGYTLLVEAEMKELQPMFQTPLRTAVFIGCGPMPITAILLAELYGVRVLCIDSDRTALDTASELVRKAGLGSLITFQLAEASELKDIAREYRVVFVAALVGNSVEQKQKIFSNLAAAMHPGQVICARSVEGIRALHYLPVDPNDMQPFVVVSAAYPPAPVLNHTLMGTHAPR